MSDQNNNIAIEKVIVVACDKKSGIGRNNELPWSLPADLKHFKSVTFGHPIIMGRKTFDSIGRPLPGRTSIVVTRQKTWSHEGVKVAHCLADAFTLAETAAIETGVSKIMIVGGAEFYSQSISDVSRIYLTEVSTEVDADAYFPPIDKKAWREVSRQEFKPDSVNHLAYAFVELERI